MYNVRVHANKCTIYIAHLYTHMDLHVLACLMQLVSIWKCLCISLQYQWHIYLHACARTALPALVKSHCNTLRHDVTHYELTFDKYYVRFLCGSVLQCVAACCSVLDYLRFTCMMRVHACYSQ